jgi:hypothetical protein
MNFFVACIIIAITPGPMCVCDKLSGRTSHAAGCINSYGANWVQLCMLCSGSRCAINVKKCRFPAAYFYDDVYEHGDKTPLNINICLRA